MVNQLPAGRDEPDPTGLQHTGNGPLPVARAQEPLPAPAVTAFAEEESGGADFRRYFDALKRYKWLVIICAVLGAAGGVLVSRFRKPIYQAQATIFVEVAAAGGGNRGPLQESQLLLNTNWLDLLRSFTVLDSVVKEQRLFISATNPTDTVALRTFDLKERFLPGDYDLKIDGAGRQWVLYNKQGTEVDRGKVGDSVGARAELGFAWLPQRGALRPKRDIEFHVSTPREAALDVNKRLDAKIPVRDGNFLRLILQGTAPISTASTLNSVADRFVHVAAELKKQKLEQLSSILADQLQAAHAQLISAETAYENFRVNSITEPSDEGTAVQAGTQSVQTPGMSQFFQIKMEADQLRRDRQLVESVLSQPPDSGISAVTLEAIPSVSQNLDLKNAIIELSSKQATLRGFLTRYTPDNPIVKRLVDDIHKLQRQDIPTLLRSLADALRSRESMLNARVEAASGQLRQIPQRAIEDARLRREVTIAENLYTTLQQRESEARIAAASSVPDVRILDPAVVPQEPISNLVPLILLGGLAVGLGVAIGLALLLDRFDRRLRYPDQVTRGLGLEILGAVPRVRTNGAGLAGDDAQQVVESLRTIRLNLAHAYGSAGPLITTITSPGSGDGKSFLASNLALAFADAGHRTLLIDGDIRRGTLHRVLNVNRKPGLLDYLGGQATREQVVQSTRVSSVDFIGCGTRKMGGPELLASPAMSQLILGMRTQYSVIILDSAPLGAGVDALVLGSLAGSMLLVLRTGVTDREMAQAKLSDLDRLPIRVLGAVLNDVKPQGMYKYYSYLPGYSSDDEMEGGEVGDVADLGERTLPAASSTE